MKSSSSQQQKQKGMYLFSSASSQMAGWNSGPKVLHFLVYVVVYHTVFTTKDATALYVPVPLNLSSNTGNSQVNCS